MAAAYVEPPAALCGYYDDDAADIDALLWDIHAVVHPPTPTNGLTTQPAQPMSSSEFLALSRRQDEDADFEAFLRGIRRVQVVPALAVAAHDATPMTPVAELGGPRSYADDGGDLGAAIKMSPKKQPPEPYDSDIDAALRAMETDPAERPSPMYLWTTQAGQMTMAARAELVAWMHDFSGCYDLVLGALHRAVSYVDRFLSATKIGGARHLRILGAAAVFAAAKYEDRRTTKALDADEVARRVGCTRREVVEAERELVAVLGYRLGGPTAYTFVEHLTRHDDDQESAEVRSLAHHLANMALLDYRCIQFLPSAVAASAIVLAGLCIKQELKVAGGYKLEDLADCMDAIYDMHEQEKVWPGCAQMMANCAHSYSLPPPWSTCLLGT